MDEGFTDLSAKPAHGHGRWSFAGKAAKPQVIEFAGQCEVKRPLRRPLIINSQPARIGMPGSRRVYAQEEGQVEFMEGRRYSQTSPTSMEYVMSHWQLQDAKARLSELVKKAAQEGPQHITLHGEPAAVLMSEAEYQRLRKPARRFVEFVRNSPLRGVELDVDRDRSPPREVRL